LYPN
jgi:hypothetical protein